MKEKTTLFFSVVTFALALAVISGQLSGCGGGSSSSPPTGTLKMSLSDKQSDAFQKLVISIKEVRVVPAGLEASADNDPALPVVASYSSPLQVDVLTLKFLLQSLGHVTVPAGSYSQIRLILADNVVGTEPVNYLVLKSDTSGTKIPVKTPSGQTSGLKVSCLFDVRQDSPIEVVVDFDPNTAIVETGNGKYIFKPTGIRVVEVKELPPAFGSITGILSAYSPWFSAELRVVPRSGGTPAASATVFSNYSNNSWQSAFSTFVPSGTYRLFVYSQGFMPYSSPLTAVSPGAETPMGRVSFVPTLIRR
jgi:hypothetical protein